MATMPPRTPTLDLHDLPPRAQSLGPDELSDVFGGCQHKGDDCGTKSCCAGLTCESHAMGLVHKCE